MVDRELQRLVEFVNTEVLPSSPQDAGELLRRTAEKSQGRIGCLAVAQGGSQPRECLEMHRVGAARETGARENLEP